MNNLFQVDAFTREPFGGNPAAVCLLDRPVDELWMQKFAREMNLSETAYLVPKEGAYDLRWFTPVLEIELCGHATLAAAHVLWENGILKAGEEARFHTKSGLLTAKQSDGWITLDFPAERAAPLSNVPAALLEGLKTEIRIVLDARYRYLVELESEATLRALRPDFNRLATLPKRGVIVTCRSESKELDFISRYFAPSAGVPEDPVTGSAHCTLAPYWGARLGKTEMVAYQASARGGTLKLKTMNDRVLMSGQAVTVFNGRIADSLLG